MAFDIFSLPKDRRDVLRDIYFNQYVDKRGPNDCWNWKASRLPKGYGRFYKRMGNKKIAIGAHRLAWMFHYNSPIPEGLLCLHVCDQPSCCNPLHIMIGTHYQNTMDSINKGRAKPWGKPMKPKR